MSFSFFASLMFLGGFAALAAALFIAVLRYKTRAERSLSTAEKGTGDFGPMMTSVRLRSLSVGAGVIVALALSLHAYWGLFAAGPVAEDAEFSMLKNRRDQRNRRETESRLRGWIFDRNGDMRRALAKYRYLNGQVIRDYPLGPAAAHLVGYSGLVRGDAMLERAVGPGPSAAGADQGSIWKRLFASKPEGRDAVIGRDIKLTIDSDLQREAYERLGGRPGAVVVMQPQTGEVLALASSPSFDPDDVSNDPRWREISSDTAKRPLLNRALGEYYLPGSTLKVVTASAAIESRLDKETFQCQAGGWIPPGSNRPIRDDEGAAHGNVTLSEAVTRSCNQYFAQLGVEIAHIRLGEAAARFGMKVYADPADSLRAGSLRDLWNTEDRILGDVLAPLHSTFVAGHRTTKYDLALESIGQGFVQATPLQMVMAAAGVANLQGNVMRPQIEMERAPAVWSQAMSPDTAARMRAMMATVVERGTAASAFSGLRGRLSAGGKTGTAQREVPVIDARTGQPATYRDSRGVERPRRTFRIDSWFIGFAPVDRPQIAIAVVVESGGYGGRTAAPIAAQVFAKAQTLGLTR